MEEITKWLKGSRNYNTGVALLIAYGNNASKVAALQQGETPVRKIILANALQEISNNTTAEQQPNPTETLTPLPKPSTPPIAHAAKQHDDDPYYHIWKPIFIEMNYWRHQLDEQEDEERRGTIAHKVCDLEDQCYKYWNKRDWYQRNGTEIPEEEPVKVVTDPNELRRTLNNVRSYVTKYRKKVKSNPTDAKAAIKLEEFEAQKLKLEKLLDVQPLS